MFETIVLKWAGVLRLVLLTICRDSAACSTSTGSCQKKTLATGTTFLEGNGLYPPCLTITIKL